MAPARLWAAAQFALRYDVPLSLFLTGVDGYLGGHLLSRLDASRYQRVHALTRRERRPHLAPNIAFIQGDLLDPNGYSAPLAECDTVLHMAAATGKARPQDYFRVNRDGTKALLEAACRAGVRRFLFISSIAAAFQDVARYYYAQSKRQAEELVVKSALEYTIVRPTILMGRGAPVIEGLSRLAAAPVVPVFGDGRARVQPVSTGELATCLLTIVENGGFENRIVEIGGPETLSIEELLLKIRRIRYGKPPRVVHLPAGPITAALGILEKFVPGLPITAGQLKSFTNDSTAEPHLRGTCAFRETIDDVLRQA
jgi:NADH dehydrogenase